MVSDTSTGGGSQAATGSGILGSLMAFVGTRLGAGIGIGIAIALVAGYFII